MRRPPAGAKPSSSPSALDRRAAVGLEGLRVESAAIGHVRLRGRARIMSEPMPAVLHGFAPGRRRRHRGAGRALARRCPAPSRRRGAVPAGRARGGQDHLRAQPAARFGRRRAWCAARLTPWSRPTCCRTSPACTSICIGCSRSTEVDELGLRDLAGPGMPAVDRVAGEGRWRVARRGPGFDLALCG